MQSVPIISKAACWNPADGQLNSIQHHVIEFVSDLRQVCRFLKVLQFPLQIKLPATYLTEILLKVVLNTIILTLALQKCRGRRGRDRMVVELTTTCAISAYHL